ncbi:MAG: hypothetical protein FWD35_02285, partial [Oscillospiraceae bacterium]|nr:hypothetical protein [Oscillospiraceae bacterium]
MLFEKKSSKIIAAVLLVVVMVFTMSSVTADQPFIPYGYDWWSDTYPIQSGWVVDRVVSAAEIRLRDGRTGISGFRNPQDILVYENPNPEGMLILLDRDSPLTGPTERVTVNGQDEFLTRVTGPLIFLVDSGNDRIIITTTNFELVRILSTFHYREDYRIENFIGETDAQGNLTPEASYAYWAEVNRVFELDSQQNYVRGTTTVMKNPRGIFVTDFGTETRIYIADYEGGHISDNGRVIAADINGGIWMEYRRPDSDTFVVMNNESGEPVRANFIPSKVVVDNAGNLYCVVPGINRGAVTFSEDGTFRGFFGANRVEQTAEAILNYFLRFVLPRDVMSRRAQSVAVNFSNLTIDRDQFIYTVTTTRSSGVDVAGKLNPAGENIFLTPTFADVVWGAAATVMINNRPVSSEMVDVAVDDKGDIFLLDTRSGQIFHYDKEGHLLFIFGGIGNQQGLFRNAIGMEVFDNTVYIVDWDKASITVFRLTEFGELVADAMDLFEAGDYAASLAPWEEVMRRDANYYMARVGMGNAKLS